ncbi:MAG: type IV secretory system conjugative DNA transfer family protein, partial [Acidobacteria bacterium]|nr:type IV secretory system conjugative DNA transfer family protein [Acidobacteriota bacterium]
MRGVLQPRLESQPESFERNLIIAGAALLALLFWAGGAFDPGPCLHAPKGSHEAIIAKLLTWDHNALIKVALNPYLAHSFLFLLACGAAAVSPLIYGLSRHLWLSKHDLALWIACFVLALVASFLIPGMVLPYSMSRFEIAWWKATSLFSATAILFLVGFLRVSMRRMSARDILREPHAYDLMDLSGAATLAELKRTGLLVRSSEWPSPNCKALSGRLCIGRLHSEGRPMPFFVAPEIAKLQQTLVVAPTGSGKTTSLALPWSRELPSKGQSVFVLDFKGDMARHIPSPLATGESAPAYWVFNPLSDQSVKWNPMQEPAAGASDYLESQDAIAEAIYGEVNGGAYQYFDLLDLRILKAGVRAVCHLEAPTLKALHDLFLSQQRLDETLDRIKDMVDAEELARIEADLDAATDSKKYSFTERIQGVRNKLDAFAHPAIQRVTGVDADFRLENLIARPGCLVFTAPMQMGLAGETLAAMAVRLIQHQLHRRYGHEGGK